MLLTRATDNRLKTLFTSGEVRYGQTPFQGKGFRSLGQEAIYAAGIRLRRGPAYRGDDGQWNGDVIAPVIRDLGATLAMRCGPETVRMVLNAQMGKAGTSFDGKDLHIGDFDWGILPPAAPLAISTLTMAGMAMAFAREGSGRVAVSFIGEGGSSLGEWHEAINLCAARRLPAIFCVENNQIALSTPLVDQSAARVFADKAVGYGIPGLTIDGTDPDAIAAAFAWAAERARAGAGPSLIELVSFRMCGHAHHDDMLYLGRDPHPSWEYPQIGSGGTRGTSTASSISTGPRAIRFAAMRAAWRPRASSAPADRGSLQARGRSDRRGAGARGHRRAVARPRGRGPGRVRGRGAARACGGVGSGGPAEAGPARQDPPDAGSRTRPTGRLSSIPGRRSIRNGHTFLDAIMLGIRDALAADPRVFVYGEDVGREIRQCVPAAAAAARGVRRSHHQLAARRGRGARRVRRRRAGRPAADRRDAVQRLRGDRLQSARQQRRQDSVPMGRERADGRAHAVGRTAPRRPVPLAEHRSLVLSNARAEDRRAVDAARRAGAFRRRPWPIPIRSSITSTSRSIAIPA